MGGWITDVEGIRVGHATDAAARTGCTVVRCDGEEPGSGGIVGVDVRGGAPGTRETDLCRAGALVQRAQAVVLTGGSAFGLEAASGVARHLRTLGRGFPTPAGPVPIVPAAVLYDLSDGRADVWPDADMGAAASRAATGGAVEEGRVGAGAGATVGKLLGFDRASPGGVGTASVRLPDGAVVGAIAAVNAVGEVVDAGGRVLAGVRDASGTGAVRAPLLPGGDVGRPSPATSTTIACVATDAALTKPDVDVLARMASAGLARAIVPVWTPFDGDTLFALSCGGAAAPVSAVGAAAADAVAEAVRRAVAVELRPGSGAPAGA